MLQFLPSLFRIQNFPHRVTWGKYDLISQVVFISPPLDKQVSKKDDFTYITLLSINNYFVNNQLLKVNKLVSSFVWFNSAVLTFQYNDFGKLLHLSPLTQTYKLLTPFNRIGRTFFNRTTVYSISKLVL